jgi:hypothetical protein
MLLGVGAVILSLADPIPYLRGMLRGATRPQPGTRLIWGAVGATGFASQLAEGASWSLGTVGAQTVSATVILVLSIRVGVWRIGRWDVFMIGVALAGIAGWMLSSTPVFATSCVVIADAAGVVLMLPKTWRDPCSETLATYALAAGSGVLSAAAVGALDLRLLLYPTYFAIVNAAIVGIIGWRRSVLVADRSLRFV